MKKLFFFFVVFIVSFVLVAQSLPGINYQGIARGENGDPIQNQLLDVKIEVYAFETTLEYRETFQVETNQFGLFILVIGTGNVEYGSFQSINWSELNKSMDVSIDFDGSGNYIQFGSQQLQSVPYAQYALQAPTASQDLANVLGQGNDAGGTVIGNVGDPVAAQDAVTLNYVNTFEAADQDRSSTNEIQDLTKSGDVLEITGNSSPTSIDLSPYLDNTDSQNLTNVLSQGNDAGGATLSNVGDPVAAQDAATKKYVDQADNQLASKYAFKSELLLDNTGGPVITNQLVDFDNLQVGGFDNDNVLIGVNYTAPVDGVYIFQVTGQTNNDVPMTLIEGTNTYLVARSSVGFDTFYIGSYIFQLTAGNTIQLKVDSAPTNAIVKFYFFGYKL